ncbi:hypothetical protein ACRZ5S_22880 (plasmid) [Vibrio scophthalmi]|uniref:hypothetical protein n=1 Tax=Vibrio scophthalmi TaxID=45658 RepID=UPI003EBF4B89
MAMQNVMANFFVVVQLLEVTLRNSIHTCASNHFGDDEWFTRVPISVESKKQVDFAIHRCLEEIGVKYTSDDLVAHLPFGFWVHMLHKDYNNPRNKDKNLWQTQFSQCFPNARVKNISLNTLFQNMGALNKFRNRLFHHEPAWKGKGTKNREDAIRYLLKMYDSHLDVIELMSSSKREMISVLGFESRFKQDCDINNLRIFEALMAPNVKP